MKSVILKVICAIIVYILIINSCFGQIRFDRSLLWEISGNGLSQPSYLYGSVHILPKEDFRISQKVNEKFKKCKSLVLENNLTAPEFTNNISGRIEMKNNTLESILDEREFRKVSDFFNDLLYMDIRYLNNIKIWALASFTTTNLFDDEYTTSCEYEFIKMAKRHQKNIEGIETALEQFQVYENITEEEQINMLMENINNYEDAKNTFHKMIKAYKEQDIDLLYKLCKKCTAKQNSLSQKLFEKRNIKWIPRIENIINHHSSFIVVGAGHLGGNHGVLNLLHNQGYSVKAIR